MKKLDILIFGLMNFLRRKARSVLTVLGVVIGTVSVIIMISIGIAMQEGYREQISQWSNIRQINVMKGWDSGEEDSEEMMINYMDDIGFEQIKALEHISAATPKLYGNFPILKNKKEGTSAAQIQGISAADMEAFDYDILYGRALNESDVGTTNFVMSYNVPFYIGKLKDPVWWIEVVEGEELPFNPVDMVFSFVWDWSYGQGSVSADAPKPKFYEGTCVGIIAQKKGGDYDNTIYMDVSGLKKLNKDMQKEQEEYQKSQMSEEDYQQYQNDMFLYSSSYSSGSTSTSGREDIYSEFIVMVDETENVQELEKSIRALGYETYSGMSILTEMESQTAFLRMILGAIGLVAFIVAAIGITNTMIMSIYERTREIGIMKVLGCKLIDVRTMFLVEAAIIGFFGGIFGIVLSNAGAVVINNLASKTENFISFGSRLSVIPLWLDGAALLLSTSVGIAAGLYPAIRATRLSALDAIKNE